MLSNKGKNSDYQSTIQREGGGDEAKEEDKKEEDKKEEEPPVDPKQRPDPDPEKDFVSCLGCCDC